MLNRNRFRRMGDNGRRSAVAAVAVTAMALVGGALLPAGPALADPGRDWRPARDHGASYDYARVVDVDPIVRHVRVRTPVRECWEETRYDDYDRRGRHDRPRRSEAGATIAGGIIGGVIGRQFGDGDGRDAMTLVGTLVGAAIGNERASRGREYERRYDYDRYDAYERTSYPVTRCETRYRAESKERIDGYRVTYRYRGQTYTTRTDYDPGDRIRVRVDVSPVRH
jgi:uncharacterized protein YcfJ